MGNTLTNAGRTILGRDIASAQEELNKVHAIRPTVNPIKYFATSLNDVPKGSTTINLPYLNAATGSFRQTGGSSVVKTNADVSNIALGINKDEAYFVGFSPVEIQQYDLAKLTNDLIKNGIHGCDLTMLSASLAPLVTPGQFATASVSCVATSFSRSAVTSLIAETSALKWNRNETVLLLKPSYYWNLIDNLSSLGNAAGAAAVQSGTPNNPFGIPVIEVQAWPTVAFEAGSGSVAGVICMRGATVLATAIPEVQHATGDGGVLVSPETGVPYLYESYYNDATREWVHGPSVLWDAKKGVPGTCLQIIDPTNI